MPWLLATVLLYFLGGIYYSNRNDDEDDDDYDDDYKDDDAGDDHMHRACYLVHKMASIGKIIYFSDFPRPAISITPQAPVTSVRP